VKQAVKRGLTQRLRQRVGMRDSDSSDEEKDTERGMMDLEEDGEATLREDGVWGRDFASEKPSYSTSYARGSKAQDGSEEKNAEVVGKQNKKSFHLLPKAAASMTSMSMLEQSMPADAVLAKEGANEVSN
jgi:metal transporter CNNM